MAFKKLHKSSRSQPESPYPQAPPLSQRSPSQRYEPPPGPPPQWPQWQAPYQPPSGSQSSPYAPAGSNSDRLVSAESIARTKILSHDEELKRLSKACKTGRGNAQLLHEAVAYAKPQDLAENDLIEEFRKKCKVTQEYLTSTIPWASAEAERSRTAVPHGEETREEALLADLLSANQEILDALQTYDELAQTAQDQKREAERKGRVLEATTSFVPTPSESALVDRIFEVGDMAGRGTISVPAARKIMASAKLTPEVLVAIWDIANVEENEALGKHCVGIAVRLAGYAQKGVAITEDLVANAGPLATIDGLDSSHAANSHNMAGPSSPSGSRSSAFNSPSPPISSASDSLPPLTPQDRIKFVKIFMSSQPENGVLSGPRARQVLLKSRLPSATLGQIWDLADIRRRGALDAASWSIAMYLVQACMTGQLTTVPPSLPPFIYAEAARASTTEAFDSQYSLGVPSPPRTSPMPPSARSSVWDISPDLKSSADAFFDAMDEQHRGYLDHNTIQSHFQQTGLSSSVSQQIWNLADVDNNGRMSRDEFAVAVHLIQCAERGELPERLPESLIPPTRRTASPVPPRSSPIADLVGLDFSSAPSPTSAPMPMSVPAVTDQHLTQQSTPPPLPPRTPRSSNSAIIWQPQQVTSLQIPSPQPTSNGFPGSSLPASAPLSPQPSFNIPAGWNWDVTPAEKASSDKFFDSLDPWKHGYIEGEAAAAFLSKSKLSTEVLSEIWDLADMGHDGRLNKEEFAVVMYLIKSSLAGRPVPKTLPSSLVPPANLPTIPDPEQTTTTPVGLTGPTEATVAESAEPSSAEPPPPYALEEPSLSN